MTKHVNIPIFIPHLGCPNHCVFCNQRTISGVTDFDISEVRNSIDRVLATLEYGTDVEIAFFGGSFTGIDRDLMIRLLEIANEYVSDGRIRSIRCSTRPDYIDGDILDILKKYRVTTVEIGFQSVSDNVLKVSKRGHNFQAELNAAKLLVERGFDLVGQMMIGLPGASLEDELATADVIIRSGASSARIYPTVVFKNTELCDMSVAGAYTPLTVDEAVVRSAAVLDKFIRAGINVIRIGLCASENLVSDDTYFSGPNHPALGELVMSEVYRIRIRNEILALGISTGSSITVRVPMGALSKAQGQKKRNKILLTEEFRLNRVTFREDPSLSGYGISVTEER